MTIFTQEEVFVNYDNVAKIQCYGDVVEDEQMGTVDVAVIKAVLVNRKKVTLGYYAEADQLEEVMSDLMQWLNEKNDYKQVFKMPAPKLYVDEENPEEQSEKE